jgi:hypothetical protein
VTPEARAARERKQKIFVVVGGLLLLALLAIQLPRLLGGSGGSEATAGPAAAASSPAAGTPATGTPSASPVSLTGRARPGLPATGKLTTLGVFERKDPFVQQIVTSDAPVAVPAGSGAGRAGKEKKATAAEKTFSLGPGAPSTPVATVVSVNGAKQTLKQGATFPASDPVFELVSELPGSKSVVVGVVGGAYTGGSKTARLVVGKPVTLVNTTTGARYRLVLVSVGNGETAASPDAKR